MHPSVKDFKNAVRHKDFKDHPIAVEDVVATEKTFDNDSHALKGKTLNHAP